MRSLPSLGRRILPSFGPGRCKSGAMDKRTERVSYIFTAPDLSTKLLPCTIIASVTRTCLVTSGLIHAQGQLLQLPYPLTSRSILATCLAQVDLVVAKQRQCCRRLARLPVCTARIFASRSTPAGTKLGMVPGRRRLSADDIFGSQVGAGETPS